MTQSSILPLAVASLASAQSLRIGVSTGVQLKETNS